MRLVDRGHRYLATQMAHALVNAHSRPDHDTRDSHPCSVRGLTHKLTDQGHQSFDTQSVDALVSARTCPDHAPLETQVYSVRAPNLTRPDLLREPNFIRLGTTTVQGHRCLDAQMTHALALPKENR